MDTANYHWAKMWQCHRLAIASNDDLKIRRFMAMATKYEAQAKAAEADAVGVVERMIARLGASSLRGA